MCLEKVLNGRGAESPCTNQVQKGGVCGQSSKDAAVMGAQIKSSTEERVLDMGQRENTKDAAVKGAQTKLRREEYASGMGQRSNDVAVMDAQKNLSKEEYVGDTEQTATPMTNLQLLHHALDQSLIKLLYASSLDSVIQVPPRTKATFLLRK